VSGVEAIHGAEKDVVREVVFWVFKIRRDLGNLGGFWCVLLLKRAEAKHLQEACIFAEFHINFKKNKTNKKQKKKKQKTKKKQVKELSRIL
jgi:hypothetical protein